MAKVTIPLAAKRWSLSTQTIHADGSGDGYSFHVHCARPNTAEYILNAASQKYAISAPHLSALIEENLVEGIAFFDFPLELRSSNRITNSLERINRKIRRRTLVVGFFPNEPSCLRLLSALLMEINEEW